MKDTHLNIRINSELLEQIKKLAKSENRTLSNYVINLLQVDIEKKGDKIMKNRMDLLKEVYELSQGNNLAELISKYEFESPNPVELEYIDVYQNKNDDIFVIVKDNITENQFELIFNKQTLKLEIYMGD